MKTPQCKKHPCNCHNGPQDAATPRPWRVVHENADGLPLTIEAFGGVIANIGPLGIPDGEDEQNAELIVRAVNWHDALLEVLRRGLECGVFDDAPVFKGDVRRLLSEVSP